ncbi:hypothetical protein G6F46_015398 [Rhizopus delemar]|nr:hypothetical protein G6F22_019434 [Rhizopus arrhizus]KAG1581188.1 hypothetical protein G6F46_015398 [Rhizopus delemar]
MANVCPSGSARVSALMPMIPLPPGRFSTITGLPQRCPNLSATNRVMMSGALPAAVGAMNLTGLSGNVAACTALGAAQLAATAMPNNH